MSNLKYLKKSKRSISKAYGFIGDIANDNNIENDIDTVEEFAIEAIKPIASISDILDKQSFFKKKIADNEKLAANENFLEKPKVPILEIASKNEEIESKENPESSLIPLITTLGLFTTGLIAHFTGFIDWFLKDSPAKKSLSTPPKSYAKTPVKSEKPSVPFSMYKQDYKAPVKVDKSIFKSDIEPYKPVLNSLSRKYRSNDSKGNDADFLKYKKVSPIPKEYSKLFKKDDKRLKSTNGSLPSNDIVSLGRALQKEGYKVGEHSSFGGVEPVHGSNSAHYSDDALDVNIPGSGVEYNNPEHRKRFDLLAERLRNSGYTVLWRVKGHFNHIHVQKGNKGIKGAIKRSLGKSRDIFNRNSGQKSQPISSNEISFTGIVKSLKELLGNDTQYTGNINDKTNGKAKMASSLNNKIKENIIKAKTPAPIIKESPQPFMIRGEGKGTFQTISDSDDKRVLSDYINYFGLAA